MATRSSPISRRRLLTPAGAGAVAGAVWPGNVARPAAAARVLRVGRREMGSLVEVLVPEGADVADAVHALDLVSDVARRFTAFDASSEIGVLNRQAARGPVSLAPDLFDLLRRSAALSRATGGAFDVAAGALWRAWGFGDSDAAPGDPGEVTRARARSGMALVCLDADARTASFATDGVEVNLGAIGKGYAVDRASDALVAAGHTAGLVHSGYSSMRAWGDAPGSAPGSGWPLQVRHPSRTGAAAISLRLSGRAMGVSGVGERFVERDGARLGHVIDPRTGRPSSANALAVAWADEAATADALSTAFLVMDGAEVEAFCAAHEHVGALVCAAAERGGALRAFGAVPPTLVTDSVSTAET